MKAFFEKIKTTENRGWGVIGLLMPWFWIVAVVALILWWKEFEKEDKELMLDFLCCVIFMDLLVCLFGWLFGLGVLAACVWLVFYIIKLVKVFKGDFSYKIPLTSGIAAKIAAK